MVYTDIIGKIKANTAHNYYFHLLPKAFTNLPTL